MLPAWIPSRTVVWDRIQEPFGEIYSTPTNTTPTNHRFPGQYFDAENSLNYNNFRDYDRSIGRYVEADPLGLGAGPNLYAYGGDNPTQNIDPLGLDYIKYMFDQLRPGAYQNGVLNTGRDTGHVAVQRYSDDGVLLNSVSVGPVGNVSNSAYMLWGQQSTSNYQLTQNPNGYVLHVDQDKDQSCKAAFDNMANPPPFKNGQNCTTAAVGIGGSCVSDMPNGIGPVSDPSLAKLGITQVNVANPAALEQQLKSMGAAPVYGPPVPTNTGGQ